MSTNATRWMLLGAGITAIGLLAGCAGPESPRYHKPIPVEGAGSGLQFYAVGDDFVAGQPTSFGFQKAKEEGVRTVVNLRVPDELPGANEQKAVEALGMNYLSLPIDKKSLNDSRVEEFLEVMRRAEGPVLIHCATANRAAGLWAIHITMQDGVPAEDAIALASDAGLRPGAVKEFVTSYLRSKGKLPPEDKNAAADAAPAPAEKAPISTIKIPDEAKALPKEEAATRSAPKKAEAKEGSDTATGEGAGSGDEAPAEKE